MFEDHCQVASALAEANPKVNEQGEQLKTLDKRDVFVTLMSYHGKKVGHSLVGTMVHWDLKTKSVYFGDACLLTFRRLGG